MKSSELIPGGIIGSFTNNELDPPLEISNVVLMPPLDDEVLDTGTKSSSAADLLTDLTAKS